MVNLLTVTIFRKRKSPFRRLILNKEVQTKLTFGTQESQPVNGTHFLKKTTNLRAVHRVENICVTFSSFTLLE